MTDRYDADKKELAAIIGKIFDALSWDDSKAPDWDTFKGYFRPDAILYPSARPAAQSAVDAFVARMAGLRASGDLKSIVEEPLAFSTTVFGNTALVYTSYSAVINGSGPSRGANAFLFVKNNGQWKIGAMAWDNEGPDAPLPTSLLP